MRARCYLLMALFCLVAVPVIQAGESPSSKILLIVLDGLRPDYVTPELMPNLYALGQRGVVCENHHAVFPTVTRVNASSIATGSYPATHGLMGNTVYFPEVDPKRGLSTGDAKNLMKIEAATHGRLLTAPSLGEILEANGKKLLTVSSGSSGSSYLTNHKVRGGGIINVAHILPPEQADRVKQVIGEAPEEQEPNRDQNRWAVDAYLKYGLEMVHPDVTVTWISDPDHTTHAVGIGSPVSLACLKNDDDEIGRILATLDERGLAATTNILVASDHGFSTHTGKSSLTDLLAKAGLKGDDVIVVEGAIYVQNHNDAKVKAIVKLLQETDWIGPVFTKPAQPGDPNGFVDGTFSFDLIHWNHARSADILAGANWTDNANEFGWKGTTTLAGTAGHGTSSPYDIHNTLIAAGPAFKKSTQNKVATGNVDLAPTILHVLGISPAPSMDGRVLTELFTDGPNDTTVESRDYSVETKLASGTYRCILSTSTVSGKRYVNFTRTERIHNAK